MLTSVRLWHETLFFTSIITSCAITHYAIARDQVEGELNPSEWNNSSLQASCSSKSSSDNKSPGFQFLKPLATAGRERQDLSLSSFRDFRMSREELHHSEVDVTLCSKASSRASHNHISSHIAVIQVNISSVLQVNSLHQKLCHLSSSKSKGCVGCRGWYCN